MPPISASTATRSPYAENSTAASKPSSARAVSSQDAHLPSASEVPSCKPKKSKWDERMRQRTQKSAMKAMERELKEEREAQRDGHVARIKERRQKAANKARVEELAKKMSGKRLERQKRRMGLTKKIAH